MNFPRIARLRRVDDLRSHCTAIAAPIPLDDAVLDAAEGSPLAAPIAIGDRRAGNRW